MDPELLEKAEAASRTLEAADLHGSVCGMAAGAPNQFVVSTLIDLLGTDAIEDETTLTDFVSACLDLYLAQDLEFHLLIPDDEEPMRDRLAGVAAWSAGFLSGFGAVLDQPVKALPDEVQEVLRDFASISGISEDEEETEENEASFMEIYEYVRIGAVLCHTLMNEAANLADDGEDETVH